MFLFVYDFPIATVDVIPYYMKMCFAMHALYFISYLFFMYLLSISLLQWHRASMWSITTRRQNSEIALVMLPPW